MNNTESLKKELYSYGFNLFYVAKVSDYNDSEFLFNNYKNIILIGSGGRFFWDNLQKLKLLKEFSFLENSENPIDIYTEYILEKLQKKFPEFIEEIIYPFKTYSILIDFQKLAVISGLGVISPYIKLVINPEFGTWISLRAAFFTNNEMEENKKLELDFCTECFKPCLNACPVSAVNKKEYNFKICGEYRNKETDCLDFCHVRKSCIIGQEHIYSKDEGLHRNKSSLETLRNYYKFKY